MGSHDMPEWGADIDSRRALQRLIFRCVSDYGLDEAGRVARRHDGDFVRGVILLALQLATGPGADDRGLSVRAASRSLAIPFETTRRKMLELEELGLVRRLADHRLAAMPIPPDEAFAQAQTDAAAFQAVLARLKALGVGPEQFLGGPTPEPAADQNAAIRAAHRLIQGFGLRTLEAGVEPHGSMVNALLFAALLGANADRITNNPQLARRYAGADTPPPDDIRRPAKPAELAERLGMPYELIRRRLTLFVDKGWARRVPGGYLSDMTRQQDPVLLATALAISQRFAQLVQSVAQTGLDLAPRRNS